MFTIVSVARLDWAKGYEFSIDALALVRDAGISFIYQIIGDGKYKEAIEFSVKQHGLDKCVTFVGSVPRNKVTEFLRQADIFLHLAVEEGFCNAVLEAQAIQLPVVVSDAGGLPENVDDGITGFVVPRRNSRAAADKIIELARNRDLRVRMGQAGRQRVEERFDLSSQIQKFESLYNAIMSRSEPQT